MSEYTGTSEVALRSLTTALAREAIFGREDMATRSLSGRKNTVALDKKKTDYIKVLVNSAVNHCLNLVRHYGQTKGGDYELTLIINITCPHLFST